MSPAAIGEKRANRRFPRVSGDEPPTTHALIIGVEFSPRERG